MEIVYDLAQRVGLSGAILLLLALVAQYRGYWFSRATVQELRQRLEDARADSERLRTEQQAERLAHSQEIAQWQRRTFNALGVTEAVTRIAEESVARTSRVRKSESTRTENWPTPGSAA